MDRRSLPMSGVVPVAPRTSPLALVPSRPAQPPAAHAPSPPSVEATQPARLVRREATVYRRLTIAFCIAFAFASGLAASFAVQASSASASASHLRQPRSPLTRAAGFKLVDGSDTKLASRDTRDARDERAPGAHAARRGAAAAPAPRAPAADAPEESRTPDVAPGELLDKGLTAD